ncbi:esterase B1-like [Anastrepha ludens]|uniref:esterase B1-like n=1 Tax=Anastrepha ludens TaxID=28586 RepID=UPI0023B1238F|nr:esterase B1-like [Anastrepha ludens]XP_053969294.1 esterase B1-like [Anastrepha ludens]XP_053969295.1 esterase B1-like [Anastrepha ludens]
MATDSGILETVELQLPQGRIRGAKRETVYGDTYYSFEGIPYAQPPVGKLRFRAPVPFGNWKETLDGTKSPPKPVQKNLKTGQIEGSEDCLYLNVFTKNINVTKQMPVMVWIFGGAFHTGRAARDHHGPDYLMREDVVFVSLNYRLSSLGFLSLSDPKLDVPGNAALKDQLLALKWVKKNIYYFNGNCNNITVFGESAGAACAHILSLSDQARGLFQQVILMSGCALNFWANMQQTDMAYRLATYHGYKGAFEDRAILAYLENLDAGKLVDHSLLNEEETRNFDWLSFAPTIEPYESDHCILPTDPLNLLKSTWSNGIPFLMGGTSFEGLLIYPRLKMAPQFIDLVRQEPELILPSEVRDPHKSGRNQAEGSRILQMYFGKEKDGVVAKQLKQDPIFDLMHLCSHKMFWHGLHRTALARSKYATAATYLYRFDFDSPTFNHHRLRFCGNDCVNGVAHGDDLSYLFYITESCKLEKDTPEYATIQRMVGIYTSFAKLGNPNCAEIKPNVWLPIEKTKTDVGLNISHEVQVMQVPDAAKLAQWDALYDKQMLYGSVSDTEEEPVKGSSAN